MKPSILIAVCALAVLAAHSHGEEPKIPSGPGKAEKEIQLQYEGKKLGALGGIVSIKEVSYRDKLHKIYPRPGYVEEGVEGLDAEFILSHLLQRKIVPEFRSRDSHGIFLKPSFEIRYKDGSRALVYPGRVEFWTPKGKWFSAWLYKEEQLAEQVEDADAE